MLATNYNIIGRYMDGVRVVGYELESTDGERLRLPKKVVEELALNKQIINCTAQKYTNPNTGELTVVLKGVDCKLSSLPYVSMKKSKKKIDKRGVIVERLVEGKNTVGYVVQLHNGERKSFRREQIMELARKGSLKNARAQMFKGQLLLRGVDCELAKLPIRKAPDKMNA